MPAKKAPVADKIQVSADEQWLKDFLARGGKATDLDTGETVDKVDDTQALTQLVDDKKEEAKEKKDAKQSDQSLNAALSRGEKAALRQKRLHERAKELEAANLEREREQAEKDEQDRIEREQAEKQARARDIGSRVESGVRNVGNAAQPLIDRVGAVRTVGGIGLLLAILALLLFTVVQVNAQGDTRLKQFWYMLNGRATLNGRVTVTGAIPGTGTSTSGNNFTFPGQGIPGAQKQPAGCKSDPNKIIPFAPPTATPDKNGCCPDGYSLVSLGLFGGQGNMCINNYNVGIGGGAPAANGSYRSYTSF